MLIWPIEYQPCVGAVVCFLDRWRFCTPVTTCCLKAWVAPLDSLVQQCFHSLYRMDVSAIPNKETCRVRTLGRGNASACKFARCSQFPRSRRMRSKPVRPSFRRLAISSACSASRFCTLAKRINASSCRSTLASSTNRADLGFTAWLTNLI